MELTTVCPFCKAIYRDCIPPLIGVYNLVSNHENLRGFISAPLEMRGLFRPLLRDTWIEMGVNDPKR